MIKKVKANDAELNPDIKAEEKSVERKSYKVYSDVLNRVFNTVEDLEAAEQEYARQQEEKERLQREKERQVAELKEKRAARAKEIEDALKERDALDKKINELVRSFTRDYGSFHWTCRGDTDGDSFFKTFFRLF